MEGFFLHKENENSEFAVASLVLGIIGVLLNIFPLVSYLLGSLAIIFGISGQKNTVGKGMAKAGLILGIVTIGLKIVFWVFIILIGGF